MARTALLILSLVLMAACTPYGTEKSTLVNDEIKFIRLVCKENSKPDCKLGGLRYDCKRSASGMCYLRIMETCPVESSVESSVAGFGYCEDGAALPMPLDEKSFFILSDTTRNPVVCVSAEEVPDTEDCKTALARHPFPVPFAIYTR